MNIERICRRYGCRPSQAVREPAWTLHHMALVDAVEGGE